MSRNGIAGSVAGLVLAVLPGAACRDAATVSATADTAGQPDRPDVVLIVLDTARADHFSCYGYPRETTPNIDAFAREAVLFRHAHSVAPWTLPAHMSMFTGLLPGEHGATWSAYSEPVEMSLRTMLDRPFQPAEPERLLASRLKEAGYATSGFSTNPWVAARTGLRAGFDHFVESWRSARRFQDSYAEFPPETKIKPEYDGTTTGRALTLFKLLFAGGRPAEPFFAFFNFSDPHFPYVPPPSFSYRFGGDPEILMRMPPHQGADLGERALLAGHRPIDLAELIPFYDASLSFADFMVGNLLDWLRERDLYDGTLIIITSDHGEHLGEKGLFSHQFSIEQELLRVPLLIKYPGGARAGTIIADPLVSNIDVYRTILSVAGLSEEPGGRPVTSIDLAPPKRVVRERLLAEYYFSEAQLRQIKQEYEPFDDGRNRVVRRAVYADGYKVPFDDLDPGAVEPVGEDETRGGPPDVEALAAWVRDYVDSIAGREVRTAEPAGEDIERLESLKALGYID